MRVLLATDGSVNSFEGNRQIGQVLSPDRDEILLYYSPFGSHDVQGLDDETADRCRHFLANAVFEQASSHLPSGWVDHCEKIIGSDDPRSEILEVADRRKADLIVVGARGLGPVERLLLGSVSRSLVHAAKVPILVARKNPARSPTDPLKILLACEKASTSRHLIKAVELFSWPSGTLGQLISVVHTVLPGKIPNWLLQRKRSPEVEEMVAHWSLEQKSQLNSAREDLEALAKLLPPAIQVNPPLVKEGLPGSEILAVAKNQKTDLIIVGAKTSTLLGRLFVGSTADAVLNHAECSVLLVRDHEV